MDAAGSPRAAVYGGSESGAPLPSCSLPTYPDGCQHRHVRRISRMAWRGGNGRWIPEDVWAEGLRRKPSRRKKWAGKREDCPSYALAPDRAEIRLRRAKRAMGSACRQVPGAAVRLKQMIREIDVPPPLVRNPPYERPSC